MAEGTHKTYIDKRNGMGIFDLFNKNRDKSEDTYTIKEIQESKSGLIIAKTASKIWGDDFWLICKSKDQIPYAQKCLEYLDNIPDGTKSRLCRYLVRYYKDFEQFLDEDQKADLGPVDESTVMNLIRIKSVIVDDDCRQDRIEFHTEGSCKWEVEHGLEVTISDNRILYVGGFEDYGPNSSRLKFIIDKYGFYNPETDMNMNYVDKDEVDELVGTMVMFHDIECRVHGVLGHDDNGAYYRLIAYGGTTEQLVNDPAFSEYHMWSAVARPVVDENGNVVWVEK